MDVRSYVASTHFTVTVTAIALAFPGSYLVLDLAANESLAFLAMFTLGVSIPQAYSRSWPADYDRPLGVAWTVGACALVLVVLLVTYAVTEPFFAGLWAAIAAFLVVQIALSGVGLWLERRTPAATETAGADSDATEDA